MYPAARDADRDDAGPRSLTAATAAHPIALALFVLWVPLLQAVLHWLGPILDADPGMRMSTATISFPDLLLLLLSSPPGQWATLVICLSNAASIWPTETLVRDRSNRACVYLGIWAAEGWAIFMAFNLYGNLGGFGLPA